MTEREEFELVAKAAGYKYEWGEDFLVGPNILIREIGWRGWNPKTNDGDSRRLQVGMGITVMIGDIDVGAVALEVSYQKSETFKDHPDKYAAVRAAVWDVALEVAKRRMEK
jgi:hypothetical protein